MVALLKPIVTPTPDYFPTDWNATDDELDDLFARVCGMMSVAPDRVTLSVFAEDGGCRATTPITRR